MSDITTTRIFTDGERGITAQKLNDIVGSSVIQPAFYTSKPTAGSADPADIALILKAGAYAQVPISTLAGSATQAQIWSTRLRSYNSLGNPTFECDQRLAGASSGIAVGAPVIDRWVSTKVGTMGGTLQQTAGLVLLPGTSFALTSKFWRVTLTTAEPTLLAADYFHLEQYVEGPQWRELSSDVHSVSLLVRSSVAGLNFGFYLKDPAASTKTLTKLCTIPVSNTWTLIQLPNLPVWPSGNFVTTPGANGYQLGIVLTCGSSTMSPANDAWQNGAFLGAVGQSNFAASPVNSTFDIAFVQHEPGAVCSTLMDKPFVQNYDECLRYYQKTYSYGVVAGTVTPTGALQWWQPNIASTNCLVNAPFKKPMAKVPTVIGYSTGTGAAGTVRNINSGTDQGVTAYFGAGDSGFAGFQLGSAPVANAQIQAHYTADTGW